MLRNLLLFSLIGAGVFSPAPVFAHDFWIDLDRWSGQAAQLDVDARFLVGHVADQDGSALQGDRVVAFESIGPDGAVTDQREALRFHDATQRGGASIDLVGDGVHVIAFATNDTTNTLAADKFNAYIADEGLTLVAAARKKASQMDAPGRESYSRRAKAMVRLGPGPGKPPAPLGQTLEITPLDNPYAGDAAAPVRFRVDYKERPLAGARISLESLSVGLLPKAWATTDRDGIAVFTFPHDGAWKTNVVWSEPVTERGAGNLRSAEYETIFASLTFGY